MNMIFDNTLSDYCLVELLLVPWYIWLETINAVCVKTVDDGASDIPLVQGRTVSPSLFHMQVQNSHYVDVDAALAILPAQSLYENDGCSEALGCHPFHSVVFHGKQDTCYLLYPLISPSGCGNAASSLSTRRALEWWWCDIQVPLLWFGCFRLKTHGGHEGESAPPSPHGSLGGQGQGPCC